MNSEEFQSISRGVEGLEKRFPNLPVLFVLVRVRSTDSSLSRLDAHLNFRFVPVGKFIFFQVIFPFILILLHFRDFVTRGILDKQIYQAELVTSSRR